MEEQKGFGVFTFSSQMNGALHIGRLSGSVFECDESIANLAKQKGIKIIDNLPLEPDDKDFGYYIDIPQNRWIIEDHLADRGIKF